MICILFWTKLREMTGLNVIKILILSNIQFYFIALYHEISKDAKYQTV